MKGCRSKRVRERKGAVVLLEPGTASSVHDLNIQSPPKMPTHSECSREVCLFLGRELFLPYSTLGRSSQPS